MLKLTRKLGERIVIADERGKTIAIVSLDQLARNRARIGIEAEPCYRIRREELEPLPLVPADDERGTSDAA